MVRCKLISWNNTSFQDEVAAPAPGGKGAGASLNCNYFGQLSNMSRHKRIVMSNHLQNENCSSYNTILWGQDGRRCGNTCMMQSSWVMQRIWAKMRSTWLMSQWVNVNHCLKTFNGCSLPLAANPNSLNDIKECSWFKYINFQKAENKNVCGEWSQFLSKYTYAFIQNDVY